MRYFQFFATMLLMVLFLQGCSLGVTQNITIEDVQVANPASKNCVDKGGTLTIQKRGDGGEYGLCSFEDNRQCEEWALFRGECPEGGLKITGYVTEAAQYCAITGGEYAITSESNSEKEQGNCTFTNGKSCDVWAYYNGECTQNE